MPSRPCVGPAPGLPCPTRQLVPAPRPGSKTASRCGYCRTAHQAERRQQRPYDHAERLEHEAIIAAHVAAYGWICSGCVHSDGKPHPSADLTVDHAERAVAHGGQRTGGKKRVICRGGNAAAGANIRRIG